MKKSLIVIVALLGTVSFFSCKKKHTCACVVHVKHVGQADGADSVSYTVEEIQLEKSTKKKAENSCKEEGNKYNTAWNLRPVPYVSTVECSLK
ncbi:MAG: hypothetical protein H6551_11120 [Chitinophagales bacterium]|nr:hypothetical protein [Chitinophagaceae bacterium]MCB9065676.1 hypothetical protein [Chitinophagales bacterium]